MANSDDDDAFLYGSDEETDGHISKKQKLAADTELDQEETEPKQASPITEQKEADEEESDEEEEDSEDDIDIIIGETAPKVSSLVPGNDVISEVVDTDAEKDSATTIIVSKDQSESKIDVNAVADYEGKPIISIDLETLKEKPWRAPGVDISDYFNYGFDEFTWTAYCHKQDSTRGEFNPQKVMADIMKGSGGAGPGVPPPPPGMPPMGMLPPGMPPMGMMPPGMQIPPGMQMPPGMPMPPAGMPPMPNMPNFQFNMPPPPPPPR